VNWWSYVILFVAVWFFLRHRVYIPVSVSNRTSSKSWSQFSLSSLSSMTSSLLSDSHWPSPPCTANHNDTSQCDPNGRHDKPPPPAAARAACDRQTNEQTNWRTSSSRKNHALRRGLYAMVMFGGKWNIDYLTVDLSHLVHRGPWTGHSLYQM